MSEETAATSNEHLVTVANFQTAAEAEMAKLALEGSGIGAFLLGENANRVIASPTELQVSSSDEAAARAILDAAVTSPATLEEVTAAEIADEEAVR